jgi:hypothetical protein
MLQFAAAYFMSFCVVKFLGYTVWTQGSTSLVKLFLDDSINSFIGGARVILVNSSANTAFFVKCALTSRRMK